MKPMKVLIACEFSQIVTEAFIKKGHDAMSCDWECEGEKGLPHYKGDVRDLLKEYWDMIIAFPDCDFLANSGVRWLHEKPGRWKKMEEGAEFFNLFLDHPCKKIAAENPIQHGYARELIRKYDQLIQPWQFGHTTSKATCLWLKNLPPLIYTGIIPKHLRTDEIHREPPGPDRKKNRSRTFQGIADAMAEQWG